MNRVLVLGIAIFFAIVGIALIGGDGQAEAARGCKGGRAKCSGRNKCRGRQNCKSSCRGTQRRTCCGCSGSTGGKGAVQKDGPAQKGPAQKGSYQKTNAGAAVPDAPGTASTNYRRSPLALRRLAFRR